jgi:hypothetical protein
MSDLIKRFVQICAEYRSSTMSEKIKLQEKNQEIRQAVLKEDRYKGEKSLLKLIKKFADERVIPDNEAKQFICDQRLEYIDFFEAEGIKELEKQ